MGENKNCRGNASQFFVAGELCRRGLVAVVTLGNCPNTDILCSNSEGTKFVHIQVKTFAPGPKTKTCQVGLKAEIDYGENFFWVLSGIPEPTQDEAFAYYIIPSKEMAKNIREVYELWVRTPGQKRPHDPENKIRTAPIPPHKEINGWDISQYLNRWDLIKEKL
jgi:hypothetical protein